MNFVRFDHFWFALGLFPSILTDPDDLRCQLVCSLTVDMTSVFVALTKDI